jgi:hypothetical protein
VLCFSASSRLAILDVRISPRRGAIVAHLATTTSRGGGNDNGFRVFSRCRESFGLVRYHSGRYDLPELSARGIVSQVVLSWPYWVDGGGEGGGCLQTWARARVLMLTSSIKHSCCYTTLCSAGRPGAFSAQRRVGFRDSSVRAFGG